MWRPSTGRGARWRPAAADRIVKDFIFVWDQEQLDRPDRVGTWLAPANIEAAYEPNTPGQIYNGLEVRSRIQIAVCRLAPKTLVQRRCLTLQSNITRWATRRRNRSRHRGGIGAAGVTRTTHPLPSRLIAAQIQFHTNVYFVQCRAGLAAIQKCRPLPAPGLPGFNQFGHTG